MPPPSLKKPSNSNLKRYMHVNVSYNIITIAKIWKQPKCVLIDEWVKKMWHERTRWQRRWRRSTSLFTVTSGIYLQTQEILQNTSWEWARILDHQKRIHSTTQNLVGWRRWEEKRRVSRTAPAPGGWGNWSRGRGCDPHIEATVWEGGETFEAGGEWSGCPVTVWMEWESQRQSLPQPYKLQTGTQIP